MASLRKPAGQAIVVTTENTGVNLRQGILFPLRHPATRMPAGAYRKKTSRLFGEPMDMEQHLKLLIILRPSFTLGVMR